MSTISVPLNAELTNWLEQMVKQGYAENKAALVRKALKRLAEEEAIAAVLKAEQEAREGKILRGDLDGLTKKI
ncbi:MAG: hypothetical protein HYT47_02980 [Candidatus Vogelbacteria bacterium]|nr:hypothetical protein [Candidatus Vogelbacteria bacterium]